MCKFELNQSGEKYPHVDATSYKVWPHGDTITRKFPLVITYDFALRGLNVYSFWSSAGTQQFAIEAYSDHLQPQGNLRSGCEL